MMSHIEELLNKHIEFCKIGDVEREYRFAALEVGLGRGLRQRLARAGLKDWRFDFAWPDLLLAVEVEGGAHTNGRHTRGAGFESDLDKYQAAMRRGWTIYRTSGRLIKSGQAIETIQILINLLNDKHKKTAANL